MTQGLSVLRGCKESKVKLASLVRLVLQEQIQQSLARKVCKVPREKRA